VPQNLPATNWKPLCNHRCCLFGGVIGQPWGSRAMLIRRVEDCLSQHPAPVQEALGQEQCNHLTALIAELAPDWSVELHLDVLREPMIVILPETLDDAIGPTLVVYRDETAFHLEELRGDAYRKLGDYRVWSDVLRVVWLRLFREMPFAPTLH
jgi:hypothetical protein